MMTKVSYGSDEETMNLSLPVVIEVESSTSMTAKNNGEYKAYLVSVQSAGMARCPCSGFAYRSHCAHMRDALEACEIWGIFNLPDAPSAPSTFSASESGDDFTDLLG